MLATRWRWIFGLAGLLAGLPSVRARAAEETELANYDAKITTDDRAHWSFQPVRRPPVPSVKDATWPRNPIDAFVLDRLEGHGWRPNPPAEPGALFRRITLDLIGLPPTLAEQDALPSNPAPEFFDSLVDSLLARPQYGERWARHWLDLVRFAESNGYERDATKPFAWRYRDYVIDSLNADKPYDRFIVEQLAGDELDGAGPEQQVATGFLRLGPWDDEPPDPRQDRFDQLDDMVSTTSQVFLGLTLGCARCHDHKFEPFTMHDYYRLVAVFGGLSRPTPGRADTDLPLGTEAAFLALAAREKEVEALKAEKARREADWQGEFLTSGKAPLPTDAVQAFQAPPDARTDEQKALVDQFSKVLSEALAANLPPALADELATLEARIAERIRQSPDLPRGYYLKESGPNPPDMHLLLRGQAASPGPRVAPGFPAVLVDRQPEPPVPTARSSGRRLALARWIASDQNPLAARVFVNRVWQFHFGEGLVRTPSDFGTNGDPPTHPELLDYLADWFTHEGGWSLKRLHRLILASNTYRMSKRAREDYAKEDPEVLRLWRVPYKRLEVEAIRDSMLAASGRLNPQMHGPSMYPLIPAEALEGSSDPGTIWPAFDEAQASRRTIYAFVKRSMVVPFLEVFDLCDTTRSTAQRSTTSVAPQALALLNSDFVNRSAAHFAARLVTEVPSPADPEKRIEHAYRLALCRRPAPLETEALREFLQKEANRFSEQEKIDPAAPAAETHALTQMCRILFNQSEFLYVD